MHHRSRVDATILLLGPRLKETQWVTSRKRLCPGKAGGLNGVKADGTGLMDSFSFACASPCSKITSFFSSKPRLRSISLHFWIASVALWDVVKTWQEIELPRYLASLEEAFNAMRRVKVQSP